MSDYKDWLISVDDHVIEPAHLWQTHVPAKYRDRAPKVVLDDDGHWKWEYEGKRKITTGLAAVAGTPRDEWDPAPMNLDEVRFPAYNDPVERLKQMDEDHVIASMVFPTYPRFCGQTFLEAADKDLGLVCIQAYNDWMIDEWSATAPGRFIPLSLLPMWDAELAAKEARRVAANGCKSVAFSENPTKLGLPSIHDVNRYWDPLFQACVETGMPISIHVGSSSDIRLASPDAPLIEGVTFLALQSQDTIIDWIWSGNLLRYPELKLVLSESGISWVPAVIERMRRDMDRQRWARTAKSNFDGDLLTGDSKPRGERSAFGDIPEAFDPLEVYQRSIFTCVVADDYGWDTIDYLGADNVMIETDFPHSDSSYPNSAKLAAESMRHLTPEQQDKVLRGNACRVYDFTPVPASSLSIG